MDLLCARCEYDLRTTPESGRCPECGLSVDESIRARGGWTRRRLRVFRFAIRSYIVGVVSLGTLVIVISGSRSAGARRTLISLMIALMIAHCAAMCIAAVTGTYAVSRRGRSGRLMIVGGLALMVGMTCTIAIMRMMGLNPLGSRFDEILATSAMVSRALVGLTSAWWMIRGHQSLSDRWTGGSIASLAALAIIVTVWATLGALALWEYATSVSLASFDAFMEFTIGCEVVASLVIAVVAMSTLRLVRQRLNVYRA